MHTIEPFYRWEKYYSAPEDESSPFFGKEYTTTHYTHEIYGYYIHPLWDYIGSETLYIKLLYINYDHQVAIIELMGEWNDALHNDIMFFKRNVIDHLLRYNIRKFILIGENVMNFHGSDDSYYEEWFEDIEDGWITAVNFRKFVQEEWCKYNIDWYVNFGGGLDVINWRTLKPLSLFKTLDEMIMRRIDLL
jgi:hypothetical protein